MIVCCIFGVSTVKGFSRNCLIF